MNALPDAAGRDSRFAKALPDGAGGDSRFVNALPDGAGGDWRFVNVEPAPSYRCVVWSAFMVEEPERRLAADRHAMHVPDFAAPTHEERESDAQPVDYDCTGRRPAARPGGQSIGQTTVRTPLGAGDRSS